MAINKIFVVGISFRSAPVAVRERLAVASEERAEMLAKLRVRDVSDAVVVSTCNRVEVYGLGDPQRATAHVKTVLGARVPSEDLHPFLYERRGRDAVHHLFRVTSSLDSLVIGEPQILGQVKEAFEASASLQAVSGLLHKGMHKAFFVAKRVRTETALGRGQVSVASVAVDLAKSIYSDLADHEVLLLGAGEIAESAARALVASGANRLVIANRNFERAMNLAAAIPHAQARPLTDLPALLEKADVVLVSTGAPGFVVTRELAQAAVKKRRGRPLFFVDVAVPRNVDPRVHDLDNCYRYDIDDLEQIVADGMKERSSEANIAEELVEYEVNEFATWSRQLEVTPTIVSLRERVRSVLATEMDKSLSGKLKHLSETDRKAISAMLEAATNKLVHGPIRNLKAAAEEPAGAQTVEAVRRVFELDEPAEAETAVASPQPTEPTVVH